MRTTNLRPNSQIAWQYVSILDLCHIASADAFQSWHTLILLVRIFVSRRCYQNTCSCFLGGFTESWLTLGDVSPLCVGVHVLKRSSHSVDLMVRGRYAIRGFCGWPPRHVRKCGINTFFFLTPSAELQQWLLSILECCRRWACLGVFWFGFWWCFFFFFPQKLFSCSEIPFLWSSLSCDKHEGLSYNVELCGGVWLASFQFPDVQPCDMALLRLPALVWCQM